MSIKKCFNRFLILGLLFLPKFGYSQQVVSKGEIDDLVSIISKNKDAESIYIKAVDVSLVSKKIFNKSNNIVGDESEFIENKSLIEWAKKGSREASSRQNILKIPGQNSIKNVVTSNKTKNIS